MADHGPVAYRSTVDGVCIVADGIRTRRNGIARFPMSRKKTSRFGTFQFPDHVTVTVTVDEPDTRNLFHARLDECVGKEILETLHWLK